MLKRQIGRSTATSIALVDGLDCELPTSSFDVFPGAAPDHHSDIRLAESVCKRFRTHSWRWFE